MTDTTDEALRKATERAPCPKCGMKWLCACEPEAGACVVCGDPRTGALTCGNRYCVGVEYGDG